MFHKEGHFIIIVTLFITFPAILAAHYFVDITWLRILIQLVALFFLIIILQFFRNPKRIAIKDDNSIASPVDGKVVVIEEVFEKEYFKEKRIQVSIFMSPINVHVTRYPADGTIVFSKYHPGKFLVAWHPKSSEENERTTVVLKTKEFGEILFRQIAGALAKRIVNYAEKDMQVIKGTDGGFIKFGSRVDLFLPLGTKINVALNDTVKGAETIIATKI